jgi:2-oxoglutarate dehydrogenase complex dehydrogenase (E1) component-like enzyme
VASRHLRAVGVPRQPLGDLLHVLRDAYCRTIGIEYMHIQEPEEKRWIQEQVEGAAPELDVEDQRHILERLNAAEAFEKFLATKYVGQKRFGLEGAESLIPILDAMLEEGRRPGHGLRRAGHGRTAAASTCWPTSSARATTSSSRSSRATSTPTRSRAPAT